SRCEVFAQDQYRWTNIGNWQKQSTVLEARMTATSNNSIGNQPMSHRTDNIPPKQKRRKPSQPEPGQRPKLDPHQRVERRLQSHPSLPHDARVRWLIDSLSYKSLKLTAREETLAARCHVEIRTVKRVIREDIAAGWYRRVGEWTLERVERNRDVFEDARI